MFLFLFLRIQILAKLNRFVNIESPEVAIIVWG